MFSCLTSYTSWSSGKLLERDPLQHGTDKESTHITSEVYLIKTANRFPQLSEYGIHLPCSYLVKMLLETPILYIYVSDSRNHEYCSHSTGRACFLMKNISNIKATKWHKTTEKSRPLQGKQKMLGRPVLNIPVTKAYHCTTAPEVILCWGESETYHMCHDMRVYVCTYVHECMNVHTYIHTHIYNIRIFLFIIQPELLQITDQTNKEVEIFSSNFFITHSEKQVLCKFYCKIGRELPTLSC